MLSVSQGERWKGWEGVGGGGIIGTDLQFRMKVRYIRLEGTRKQWLQLSEKIPVMPPVSL